MADAVGLEVGNLAGDNDPSASPIDIYVLAPLCSQAVDQVLEVLDMAALV